MTELFTFLDVWVRRAERSILRGVTATIPAGGITAIHGASGSGKSTLLRLCNRLVVPSSGTVALLGDDLATIDPIALRRRVGMIFQRPTTFPGSVADNLRAARAMDDDEARSCLAGVGLGPDLLDQDAATLSGGEAQRMCMARTLATGCEVLLADECTSSLDTRSAEVVEMLTRRFADDGRTVLWVTHDRAQRERLADRSLKLEGGRVVD